MVYTITLNPALDRTIWVREIKPEEKSTRIQKEVRFPGGKGIDVSRVLTSFGVINTALGFVGGFTGEELEGRLLNEGVRCEFIRVYGETRTNIIVHETAANRQMLLSAEGPEIEPHQLMQMVHLLERLDRPEIIALSGSLPPGIHPQFYHKIIAVCQEKGAKVLLDADGEVLRAGIQARPDIIKPNIKELGRLVGVELKEFEDIVKAAVQVHEQGVETVLVSMGERGMLLVGDKVKLLASPPQVEVLSTVGAGDSAVAGFIYGLLNDRPLKEALAFAVAAGTATTTKPGTALATKEDFMALVPQVTVKEI